MKLVGSWWLPDEEKHLTDWIRDRGEYQEQHRANALKHVKNWRVCLDVGAHVGLWSRELSRRFGEVHAFEPVLEHRLCFAMNVPAGNVTLHTCALGEATGGTVKMHTEAHSTGGTHVDPGKEGDVPLRTIDSFAFPVVDFIKVDCEGYEIYVLKGAQQTLLSKRPVVCIEQKNHQYFGNPRYLARDYLLGLGMKELGRVHDDIVLGW